MPADIFLKIGIDQASLQKATSQVQAAMTKAGIKPVGLDPKQIGEYAEALKKAGLSGKDLTSVLRGLTRVEKESGKAREKWITTERESRDSILKTTEALTKEGTKKVSSITHSKDLSKAVTRETEIRKGQHGWMEKTTTAWDKQGKAIGTTVSRIKDHTKSLAASIGRMAQWAIGWTLLYSAMRFATQVFQEAIKGYTDFEAVMARVRQVSTSASGDINQSMKAVSSTLREYLKTHSITMEAAGEALYRLSTAHLNSKQVAEAFNSVMDLTIIATRNLTSATEDSTKAAEIVAGLYNNFRYQLQHLASDSEKFRYLSALLARTYADQQVELSELADGLKYVIQSFAAAGISVEALIASIGVLNTKFVKSSRAGTGLRRVILAISKSADKMAQYLDLATSPDKTIQYLKIIEELSKRIREGEASAKDLSRFFEIFGLRGVEVSIALANSFEMIKEQIDRYGSAVDDMGKMVEDRMNTTTAQLIITKNLWGLMGEAALGAYGPDIVDRIRSINETLKNMIPFTRTLAMQFFMIANAMGLIVLIGGSVIKILASITKGIYTTAETALEEFEAFPGYLEAFKEEWNRYVKDIVGGMGIIEEANKKAGEKLEKELERIQKRLEQGRINFQEERTRIFEKHKYQMMEIEGYDKIGVLRQEIIDLQSRETSGAEFNNKLLEKQLELEREIKREALALADTLEKDVVGALEKIREGTGTIKDIFTSMIDTLQRDFLEQLVHDWFGGILKEISAVRTSVVYKAHKEGSDYAYDKILKGFVDGAASFGRDGGVGVSKASNAVKQLTGGEPSDAGGVGIKDLFNLAGIGKSEAGNTVQQLVGGGPQLGGLAEAFKLQREAQFPLGIKETKDITAGFGGKGFGQVPTAPTKAGIGLGGALGAAGGAYGVYQAYTQGPGGMGGAMSGAMSGAMMGSVFGPVGTAVGAVVGGLLGAFGGKKQEIAPREQTSRVTSKIEITNKKLEVINRNLSAIREKIQPFPLPESYYFSASASRSYMG